MCVLGSVMRGMQLVRPGAFGKTHDTISSVLRNTSCSHGWLRLLVQTIFAIIIVTSFILIVFMVVQNPWSGAPSRPESNPRCTVTNCRVTCNRTPFYEEYESEIVQAVTESSPKCKKMSVTLIHPKFQGASIPVNWFSGLRANIYELIITGGNLMHIPPSAFMSQVARNIHTLVFHNITIRSWMADSLVGLSSLRRIYVKDCSIVSISWEALRAVDDTLETLTISGSQEWNPSNITGSSRLSQLTTVDFSANNFHDVLGKNSFTGLEKCQVLYLNSCRITAIGAGAFDNLLNIEMLFLNNNFLVTIPSGLFSNIAPLIDPRPRINLQDNYWDCDCRSEDIEQLVAKDLLLLDPICHNPSNFQGKTFSEFREYCRNESSLVKVEVSSENNENNDNIDFISINGGCYDKNKTKSLHSYLTSISPVSRHRCSSQITIGSDIYDIARRNNNDPKQNQNNWLKFTFFLKTERYSMVQVAASSTNHNEGLLWYESECPNEIYCIDTIPTFLRMYNVDLSAKYVFCPISLSSGSVVSQKCVLYNLSPENDPYYSRLIVIVYVSTIIGCLILGASFVYALVHNNPKLLKGNKRILFVKHKTVDALVLPPTVPVRNCVLDEPINRNDDKIFIVPGNNVMSASFSRQKSTRSNRSGTPSYISALQPTEDQLAQWRITHHFNNDLSVTTIRSELSTYSWIHSSDPSYYSLDFDNEITK